jgi:hypothetical protein
MSGRYDNALNFANTAAQFQQARMLAAQTNVMQAQLNAQQDLVALEKQKSMRLELEKQARQQLIDIEFEFKKITNFPQQFPLYSYYYCEHMFGIIARNNFFNQYLTEVNDIRLARETATQIESHMQSIASNNSKLMETEYPFYSQGMANMPIIEETLGLIHSRTERREQSIRKQEKYAAKINQSTKNAIFSTVGIVASLALPVLNFKNYWTSNFCGIGLISAALFVFFLNKSLDKFKQISVFESKKKIARENFQHDEQRVVENTEILGFHDPAEIGEWLTQNQQFFSSRNPI